MAYIPKEEDEQQAGMNVLAPQAQQNTQQEAQNQPQNVSGGQSATIGVGQAQQGSQGQSQAPSKQAKSGMFTNIKKYIEQNKPGAQNMSNKLQSNVSQQNQSIQQAVNKQKTDFMSRVQSNRERMQGAQQFGQQTLQQAQAQESMPMLQQQQQDIQQRVGQFGNVTDQTQNINQYTGQVNDQQAAYAKAQADYQAAQNQFQQSANQLVPALGQLQSGTTNIYNRFGDKDGQANTYYSEDQLRSMVDAGEQTVLGGIEQSMAQDQQTIAQIQANMQNMQYDQNAMQQLQEAQDRLNTFQQYKQNLQAKQSAQQSQSGALTQLESYQDQLGRANEQQRLFQNKQQLQGELSELEQRIQNAPESLTEKDIERFNNLRTGVERFDSAILNLSQQSREVENLTGLTDRLGTSQGRRDLMRQEFGNRGGYTSGQASLDNLILTGDPQAMQQLISNSQAQAKQAQDTLQQAYIEGKISQDELSRGTRNLQRDLEQGVQDAQSALQQGLEERARTGEGTYTAELRDKLSSGQGLSAEDMNILGITGQERFNVDPNQLLQNLQIDPEQFGIQDVANLTDVARAQALARLSGEDQQKMLLNEDEIRQRALAGEGEEFTRTFEELSQKDQAGVWDFKDKLKSGKVFNNAQEAIDDIKNGVASYHNGNELAPVADLFQSLVTSGQIQTPSGTITLEQVRAGDEQALNILQGLNYWAWAGQGRHGVATPLNVLKGAIDQALNKAQAVKSAYSGANNNALRSETQSAYVGQDPVDFIRKS